VCEPAAEPTVGNDCTVQSPVTGKYFDLKLLGNVVNVEGITICQEEGTPTSCDGAGVCVEGESYGKYNTALTFVDDGAKGELFLEFKDGPSCSSGMQRHSKIEFMCDPAAGAGSPKMVNNDGGCSFYYQWHTAYACPDQNSIECYVLGPNQESYDLSPLTRTSGESWSAEIDNDASYQYNYLVNVCSELTSPVMYTDSDCRGAAACQVDESALKAVKLGYAKSRIEVEPGSNDLLMKLVNGDKCGDDTHRETTVRYHCSPEAGAGVPKYLGETTHCKYEIKWDTQYACPLEVQEDIPNCEVEGYPGLKQLGSAAIEWSQDGNTFEFALCNAKKRKCGGGRQGYGARAFWIHICARLYQCDGMLPSDPTPAAGLKPAHVRSNK
jgi:hypothetical protein